MDHLLYTRVVAGGGIFLDEGRDSPKKGAGLLHQAIYNLPRVEDPDSLELFLELARQAMSWAPA